MGIRDKRIDSYILKSADFAIPILTHLRELVHVACPDVEETLKWSFPNFEYKGMMCHMAGFKNHCSFGFFKASLMKDKTLVKNAKSESGMGHLGAIKSLKDLPSDKVLIQYIKEAAKLNAEGIKVEKKKPVIKKLIIPPYFIKALKSNKAALNTFEAFSYSNQKEYIEWITEAKTEVTRDKRMDTALEWMAEGKIRNWKYLKK
ncbi:MAG: YdeI/OmpD-associated family protein [Flammeovirgaceae bacterium]|jgi:uncharacterized protein YdeI (YjbR/CyaY-like superfamily)|nr:YdeI/OmpD-associated family protein [Flammeovirgaceae bacterium]